MRINKLGGILIAVWSVVMLLFIAVSVVAAPGVADAIGNLWLAGVIVSIMMGNFLSPPSPAELSSANKTQDSEELSTGIRFARIAMSTYLILLLPPLCMLFFGFEFLDEFLPGLLNAVLCLGVYVFTLFSVTRIAIALEYAKFIILIFALLSLWPGVGFILLFIFNSQASEILRNRGFLIGTLGVKSKNKN